jgi:hypothetical protein
LIVGLTLIVWLSEIADLLDGEINSQGSETAMLVLSDQKIVLIEGRGGISSWAASGQSGDFSPPLGPGSYTSQAAVSALRNALLRAL